MTNARARLTFFAALATFLSTFALWSLFETRTWPYVALVIVALMAATGWATRRVRLPGVLTPLAYAAVLLIALTFLYVREFALLGLIPTPASFDALRELLINAFLDVRRYATPAPETRGLMLLTIGGIGLVAALVDLIAVRLRRPGAAGLPMLALYSVSAGVLLDGPGFLPFLLGAAGFLALLLADNRDNLERWGRPVFVRRPWERRAKTPSRQTADTGAIASLGRRIGFAAVLIAVLAPMLVPMTDRSFAGGDGPGSTWLRRFGAPTLQAPDPVVSMRRDLLQQSDEVMFRYTSTSPRPEYLRTVALTDFDGENWRPGRLRGYDEYSIRPDYVLNPPAGTDQSVMTSVRTEVEVSPRVDLTFLPAPYMPAQARVDGNWYYDPSTLTIFSPRGSPRGLRYTVDSEVSRPRPRQLDVATNPSVLVRPNLDLPRDLPREVRETANDVTRGKDTRYKQALALQEWFTDSGGFTYSTQPGGSGDDALLAFLRDRRGYCEQYASTMAVMARTLGIPSRVAIGYTQGDRDGDEWVVRGRDAHAWPELWFEGVGWIRFEPTPSGFTGQGTAEVPGYSEPNALDRGNEQNTEEATDDPTSTADGSSAAAASRRQREELESGAPVAGGENPGISTPVRVGLLAFLLLAALVVLAPAIGRRLVRRRRWARARDPAEVAHAAWAELRDDATDLGLPFRASESPRAAGARLAARLDKGSRAAVAVERIALAEERARYAPEPDTPDGLRSDVARTRVALAHDLDRRSRVQAFLLPRSVTQAISSRMRGLTARGPEPDPAA